LKKIRERLQQAGEKYWALQVEIQEREVTAWALMAEGKPVAARRQMEEAAKLEDGTEKSAVTPGPLAPARELLGELLLVLNQPADAMTQFEATLQKEPGRFRALYGAGRAAKLAGKEETSRKYFRELLNMCQSADKPRRPELAEAATAIAAD
jgi:hypothetical protein